MSDPIIVTRDKVKREWSDFEPKLIAALLSGSAATVVTSLAARFGIDLPPEFARAIPLIIAGFVGWLTPSVGTTVTKKLASNGTVSETHSGNPVTTFTSPTPVQAPAMIATAENNWGAKFTPQPTNDAATQVLGDTFGDRFLGSLPSANRDDD